MDGCVNGKMQTGNWNIPKSIPSQWQRLRLVLNESRNKVELYALASGESEWSFLTEIERPSSTGTPWLAIGKGFGTPLYPNAYLANFLQSNKFVITYIDELIVTADESVAFYDNFEGEEIAKDGSYKPRNSIS